MKNNYGSYLSLYKHFFRFELLARKNKIEKKVKTLLGIDLIKCLSESLSHMKDDKVIQAHKQMFKIIA